jgi:hypothetical protein
LPSITIAGRAEREVVPDIAILQLSVSTEKKSAAAAAEETARSSQTVLDAIKAQGIDSIDIKTAVTVSPVFDEKRGAQGQRISRSLRGYIARNSFTVRLRDIGRAGALARTLIDKGASTFEGIHFQISDDVRRLDELRVAATKDASRQASLYAGAAGVRLGRVLTIEPENFEEGNGASLPSRRAAPPEGAAEIVTTVIPVEPGVSQVSARVTVTWEIVQ